ncbi:hypothetical protein Poli38472_001765 [Pythium oligandrum]|uniref:subtilisin n=1 Tax=Pythium oligandrum TaxID=41045 RepID=A0A8K1CU60_PYTOL|nr:hypothetical protein Poli38472_001765 [Pythium oligandrum]|eukprot:TMW69609.1 hypothetical protein Poli38472_001765 [Pythium oligandrum]
MVFTKFAPLVAATALLATDASAAIVDPAVHRTLRQQGNVNLIVTMKKGTHEVLNAVHEASFTTRGALIEDMVSRLQQHAEDSQVEVGALVAKEAAGEFTKAESFWISNQLFVEGASATFLERLTSLSSVAEVREERRFKVPQVTVSTANSTVLANEWGVAKIQAPEVWAAGNTGKGVIVSAIDTGVRGTHTALKGNYRGAYGWFDPEAKKADPYDNNGHGSHVMGTIAGANGIGVAPGATWIACKGCRTEDCPESDLLSCAQFITCPTDTSGANADCSKAPHVVSNSWGGGQADTWYKASVDAWRTAGIIPIFANGNEGPACTTSSSPGDYDNVIAVGATDSSDGLASFSSKGPSKTGLLKPEISAPGYNVRSSWNTGDSAYSTISGTSMATPHVSGVVALLLAAKPGLTYDQVKDALIKNVDTATLKAAGQTCGGTKDGVFPNNNFGYGRLNALKTVGASPVPSPSPSSPSPTTQTPAPTTKTPAPTTPAPSTCADLGFLDCYFSDDCTWSWSQGKCVDY